MNYFELFELPVSLQVDKMWLSKKYFELQKKFHPDFYTQDEAEAQKDALEKSSMINKALKTLQKPQETIKYVLQLKGLIEDEEKYQLPPGFLMEMMELNEKLLEEDAEEFRREVDVLESTLYSEVQNIIENYNDQTVTNDELLKVKEYYFKKKYLQRILDRLDD
ncbi:MAG: Fe-S protein assembly co-chaperone HscB [Ferruginibacter sp.]